MPNVFAAGMRGLRSDSRPPAGGQRGQPRRVYKTGDQSGRCPRPGRASDEQALVRLWDFAGSRLVAEIPVVGLGENQPVFDPREVPLPSTASGKPLCMRSVGSEQTVTALQGWDVDSFAVVPDGSGIITTEVRRLASADKNGNFSQRYLHLWALDREQTRKPLKTFPLQLSNRTQFPGISCQPNGRWLAFSEPGQIGLWDIRSERAQDHEVHPSATPTWPLARTGTSGLPSRRRSAFGTRSMAASWLNGPMSCRPLSRAQDYQCNGYRARARRRRWRRWLSPFPARRRRQPRKHAPPCRGRRADGCRPAACQCGP